jgi:hypothetical protein
MIGTPPGRQSATQVTTPAAVAATSRLSKIDYGADLGRVVELLRCGAGTRARAVIFGFNPPSPDVGEGWLWRTGDVVKGFDIG